MAVAKDEGQGYTDARLFRSDMHCHSRASSAPVVPAFSKLGIPECYSPPEKIYEQAMTRGMNLVTMTDHDSIDGVNELIDRGFAKVYRGEEVTVHFPEDGCKLHVLVWGHSPEQHEAIATLRLREDVYQFAAWLAQEQLVHSLAHPLYVQNRKLSLWHLERCALLFKGWEVLNGAHADEQSRMAQRFLGSLTPARIGELSKAHEIKPLWGRMWEKLVTAGSDDHALMNVGRTWTGIPRDGRGDISPEDFLADVLSRRSVSGGQGGHSSLLAHQLLTVAVHSFAENVHDGLTPRRKLVSSKLGRFAGVAMSRPTKRKLVTAEAKRRLKRRRKKSLPVLRALRRELNEVLDKYPDLRARLNAATWADGAPMSQHERMTQFGDDLVEAVLRAMAPGTRLAFKRRDKHEIFDYVLSYLVLLSTQAPYVFSLFHQNKERMLLEQIDNLTSRSGEANGPLERPLRVAMFTDTVSDVNGVCRFIRDMAREADAAGRELSIISSRPGGVDGVPGCVNFEPVLARSMPKYPELQMVLPPIVRMMRYVDQWRPDVIHIATPGPVGLAGWLASAMLRVPMVGVYHTDFPAYIDRFFEDDTLTRVTASFMKLVYGQCERVITRSRAYTQQLTELGLDESKIVSIHPGVETVRFHSALRDEAIWGQLGRDGDRGIDAAAVKFLYVGRISVEKNMPMLARIWREIELRSSASGKRASLILVGDGPYRSTMEKELHGCGAHFLGVRRGGELSAIYASCDAFVFPSVTDTLGQVVMEALASGLPALVTDVGGPQEVVRHDTTGFVLKHDDDQTWVHTIELLTNDDDTRRRMGEAAHESMQAFDTSIAFREFWDAHADAWRSRLTSAGALAVEGSPRSGPMEVAGRTRP